MTMKDNLLWQNFSFCQAQISWGDMIQSLVENRLMEAGFINIAEHYISYRLQRDLERNGYGDKVIVHLRFEQTK